MPPEIPRDRALTDDELEDALVYALLHPGNYSPGLQGYGDMLAKLGINQEVGAVVEANGGSEALGMRIRAILWRWVTGGVLVPNGPNFEVAPGAEDFLESRGDEAEIVLHRSGLVKLLQARCPGLDEVTERHAAFAQESFLVGHYQATAVMIGVASEAALVHFVPRCEAVLNVLSLRRPARTSDQPAALVRWIDTAVTQHRSPLRQAVEGVGEKSWISDLPALLGGPATGIRLTRNQAGHPTAHSVSRDECRSMLGLFPRLAEAMFVSASAFDKIVATPSVLS